MKKLLYCAAALGALLFAGSCQRENLEPAAGSGTVTFTVKAPDALATKGTINDGATIADGENVNVVHYALYKTNDDEPNALKGTDGPLAQGKVEMKNKQATAKFDLLQDQEYTILFWAQVAEEDGMNAFYELGDLRKITLKKNSKDEYDGNNEKRAAFYARYDFSTENHMDHTVTLYRPFSQLNLLTTKESLAPKYEGQTSASVTIDVEESMVTVHGTSSTFDMINGTGLAGEDQTFSMYATPAKQGQETLAVNEVAYHYVSMNYLFVPDDEALLTVDYEIVTDKGKVNNTVLNVPLKENYRTNIIGNLLTKETQFNIVVDQRFNEEIDDNLSSEDIYLTDVNTDEDLEKALKRTEEHIVIDLGAETTVKSGVEPKEYFVNISSAVEKYYFGGPDTKSITINANGNKINFIQNDGDWNYVRLANPEAKLIINDAVLTNSNKNTGHWKRNLIRFEGEVEFNNVKSEKGLCMMNDAVLNDIEINVADENYALWITAQGQTVEVDGLNITATNAGRGIKIADEDYENSAEKIVLEVKNATFVTAKKAAVLVTSTAGAEITWGEGNNINGVAADPVNAVWVDEERSDYYDEVVVTGATKRLEGTDVLADGFYKVPETEQYVINSLTGFKAFAESVNNGTTYKDATVKLEADIDLQGEPWTPIGMNADKPAKFQGTFDGQDHTISKLRVGTSYGYADGYTAAGLFGALNGTAKNFTLDGVYVSHISTGNSTTNGVAAVAGSIYTQGAIDNVTVRNANVYGNRYLGIIAGYVYGSITNCTVEDVNLKATPNKLADGSYDNGDKVGAIAGYFVSENVHKIDNNTVSGFDIRGYRDCGAIVGAGNAEVVKNNTATNGSVTADQTINFYGDKDFNVDYIVGRKMSGTVDPSNTSSNVELTSVAYVMDDINEALSSGTDYTFTEDVKGTGVVSNSYGSTGINQINGGTIDGNGKTLEVSLYGTWDSAINTTGGIIKNLTIAKGFRGIFVNHNSNNCSKVYIENVIIDGPTYTISCDQGTNNGLEAVGSTFNGWTSYAATIGDVKFTDCNFGEGAGYAFCRPYAPTEFVGCAFEAGYVLDACAKVTFENCTLGGVALTADNLATLVTSNTANATVK